MVQVRVLFDGGDGNFYRLSLADIHRGNSLALDKYISKLEQGGTQEEAQALSTKTLQDFTRLYGTLDA